MFQMKAGTITEAAFFGRKRLSKGAGGGGGSIFRGEVAVSASVEWGKWGRLAEAIIGGSGCAGKEVSIVHSKVLEKARR